MKLLGSATISPYARKVRIVLAEKKIDCDFEIVDVAAGRTTRSTRTIRSARCPTLLLDDGTALYDSRVIVEFLDNASPIARLIPADNRERVAVRRWEALADGVPGRGPAGALRVAAADRTSRARPGAASRRRKHARAAWR